MSTEYTEYEFRPPKSVHAVMTELDQCYVSIHN